jgi:hypothetical protein
VAGAAFQYQRWLAALKISLNLPAGAARRGWLRRLRTGRAAGAHRSLEELFLVLWLIMLCCYTFYEPGKIQALLLQLLTHSWPYANED